MTDNETTIQTLKDAVGRFRTERKWGRYHTPKNLSMSIAIEAAELMEHYQWMGGDPRETPFVGSYVPNELADIAIYLLSFCDLHNVDLAAAIESKMHANAEKYPVNE